MKFEGLFARELKVFVGDLGAPCNGVKPKVLGFPRAPRAVNHALLSKEDTFAPPKTLVLPQGARLSPLQTPLHALLAPVFWSHKAFCMLLLSSEYMHVIRSYCVHVLWS